MKGFLILLAGALLFVVAALTLQPSRTNDCDGRHQVDYGRCR